MRRPYTEEDYEDEYWYEESMGRQGVGESDNDSASERVLPSRRKKKGAPADEQRVLHLTPFPRHLE